jgi:glutaredoxin 3
MSTLVTPILFVKIGCPWCDEVIDYLDTKKIAYEKVVVSGDRAAMDRMINLSGQSKAPTMDWDGEILADFGVDELIPFLKSKGRI